jgi:hypothetical protein
MMAKPITRSEGSCVLSRRFPSGVSVVNTTDSTRVIFAIGSIGWCDRRILGWAGANGFFIFVILTLFFAWEGMFHYSLVLLPILIGASVAGGLYMMVRARRRKAQRQSRPAVVELGSNRLLIDESGFIFSYRRPRRHPGESPMHTEYSLSDLVSVRTSSCFDDPAKVGDALQIQLKNGLYNYHLKGRAKDQLESVAKWLTDALERHP